VAAIDSGVEGDAVSLGQIFYLSADRGDDAGGFVAHDDRRNAAAGGAIVAVDVAAADAAGFDADQDFVGLQGGDGEVDDIEVVVFGKK
jgi:hypothetical protein